MLKYIDYAVTFAEIPDEISLCLSISNCDGLCEGCHSPELRENIGDSVEDNIEHLIQEHLYGITCVCFLGEGGKGKNAGTELKRIISFIRDKYPQLKIALYSGRLAMDPTLVPYLDYYKVGPYIAKYGPLNKRTTNQKLYEINREKNYVRDITCKFWRNDEN